MIRMETRMNDCIDTSYEDLLYIYNQSHNKRFFDPIMKEISQILFLLGIKPGLYGYRYLQTAIKMVVEDREVCKQMTSYLYPEVAKLHNSTPSRVERAMRHARECIDPENMWMTKIFVDGWARCTNRDFISRIADYILMNLDEGSK